MQILLEMEFYFFPIHFYKVRIWSTQGSGGWLQSSKNIHMFSNVYSLFQKYLLSAYLCEALFTLESLVQWDIGITAGYTNGEYVDFCLTLLCLQTKNSLSRDK